MRDGSKSQVILLFFQLKSYLLFQLKLICVHLLIIKKILLILSMQEVMQEELQCFQL